MIPWKSSLGDTPADTERMSRLASQLLDPSSDGTVWGIFTGAGIPEAQWVKRVTNAPEHASSFIDPATGMQVVLGPAKTEEFKQGGALLGDLLSAEANSPWQSEAHKSSDVIPLINPKGKSPEESVILQKKDDGDVHFLGAVENGASFLSGNDTSSGENNYMYRDLGYLNDPGFGNAPRSYAGARMLELAKKRRGGLGDTIYKGHKNLTDFQSLMMQLMDDYPDMLGNIAYTARPDAIPLFADKGWGFENPALVEKLWRDRGYDWIEGEPRHYNVKTPEDVSYDMLMDRLYKQLKAEKAEIKKKPPMALYEDELKQRNRELHRLQLAPVGGAKYPTEEKKQQALLRLLDWCAERYGFKAEMGKEMVGKGANRREEQLLHFVPDKTHDFYKRTMKNMENPWMNPYGAIMGIVHVPVKSVRSVQDTLEGRGSNNILGANDFRASMFYIDPASLKSADAALNIVDKYYTYRREGLGGKDAFEEALRRSSKGLKSDARVKDVVLSDEGAKKFVSGIYRGLEPLLKQRRITEAVSRRF